jgi:hypothetical protein
MAVRLSALLTDRALLPSNSLKIWSCRESNAYLWFCSEEL